MLTACFSTLNHELEKALISGLNRLPKHNISGSEHLLICVRGLTTRSVPDIQSEFKRGQNSPHIVPFELTEDQAGNAFTKWHARHYFSPSHLLQNRTAPIRAALLPFWLFETQVRIQYTGQVGRGQKHSKELVWEDCGWQNRGSKSYPWTSPLMQIYGSYRYRRDFIAAAKVPNLLSKSRPLSIDEAKRESAQAGADGAWMPLDPPEMQQSIAWELALQTLRRHEIVSAQEELLARDGCQAVREVQVKLKPMSRRARLVFLPAFIIDYQYGEVFDAQGTRRPQLFQAVVGGVSNASVAAERHFSPTKVQVGAAIGIGSLTSLAAAVELQGQNFFSPASLLAALMVCTSAGLAARLAPVLLRQHEENERIMVEEADMEKVMSQGMRPQDAVDDTREAIWSSTEWRRWEEANKWTWNGERRKQWAILLWRRQITRKTQLAEFARNKAKAEARYKFDQQAEARRRARWGYRPNNDFSGAEAGGGRVDFKGYYALLGLDGNLRGSISRPQIKAAFRKAAKRWHPDAIRVDSESEREQAHVQFGKVRRAYDVLLSPEKRKEYDSGTDPA